MAKNKDKKTIFIIITVIVLILITIGVSYALWTITKEQTGENVVGTTCLDVTIENEENSIEINDTQPILDEEGLKLQPYSFTVKNNCEEYADYTINLEMLSETTLDSKYVSIALNEKGDKGVPTILDAYKKYDKLKINGTN